MRQEPELIQHLKILGLDEAEARIYIYLVKNGSAAQLKMLSDLKIGDARIIQSLLEKGMIIKSAFDPSKVTPLHPRNAAANLYKLAENKAIEELREKRRIADRLGMVLEPEFEASQQET